MKGSLKTNQFLPGYSIIEQIYSGTRTIVYRGIRQQDQKPVIIKTMRSEYPNLHEIAQFRSQYAITKNLNLSGIVKTYSLEHYRNRYAIVMEDFGGISLQQWIEQNRDKTPLNLELFIDIAIQIASILDGLHRHRIIHKDIKPANILIHPSSKEVRIIDFSISSVVPTEAQSLTNLKILEGTLSYISPEQTGRMNRGLDYRTDFYSLGITLFELLTGRLPFPSSDRTELIYCHIAKEPPRANSINPNIPPILSDIIAKLMAKNAEDRYQSASGLKHDLEICKQKYQKTKTIDSFELATKDISDRFLIPEKLYGRHREVETLLAAYQRVTAGKTEVILVTGDPGVGKTAVVNEIHKPILRQRSYFIKGKFDQFQRNIPFSAWLEAFRDLIRQLLSESDKEIEQWKAKILSALGDQAQVIINVIPQLEQIIGQQPPVAELPGIPAENRFNLLFQRFIQVFSNKERPLVIFLDDLQWADTASLRFIELLMNSTDTASFLNTSEQSKETNNSILLIGAYRECEVYQTHPLFLTLNKIEKSGVKINKIELKNLTFKDINTLIADTLRCLDNVVNSLTEIVFAQTKGNPFFTNKFLRNLYKNGLINFNFDRGNWQYNLSEIMKSSFTDDVVEFLASQIKKLPTATQEVLKLAACIGNQFDLKTLATVLAKNGTNTVKDLYPALQEGLITPQSEDDNLVTEIFKTQQEIQLSINDSQFPKYKFVHDRVQQAAYSLISPEQKQRIHLKIGQLLLNEISVLEREDNIFIVVNQLNLAQELITAQVQRDELARMNLLAGRKALASTAYVAAMKYLTTGIKLLTDNRWEKNYELTLALYEAAAKAAYLAGEFEQMKQFVQTVLVKAKTLLDKVKIYEITIQSYGAQNQAKEAIITALKILKELGVELPENPTQSELQKDLTEISLNLADRSIQDLVELPNMKEPQALAAMLILSRVMSLVYQAAPELFPLFACKQVDLSLKYGNAPSSSFAYVIYGTLLCGVLEDIESGYKFGKLGLNLLDKFNVKDIKPKILFVFNSTIAHWKKDVREVCRKLQKIYSTALEMGDLEYAAYALIFSSIYSYWMGKELSELKNETIAYSNAIKKINQEISLIWNEIYRQTIFNLCDDTENPWHLVGEAYDESKMLLIQQQSNDVTGLFHLYLNKLHLAYLFHLPAAVEYATVAEKYIAGGTGQLVIPIFYFYDSLAWLAAYSEVEKIQQQQILEKVKANQLKMHRWADSAPMNYLHKYYLVEAEKYRVLQQYLDAIDYYDRAIFIAKENGYINEEALANELAGRFYLEWGKQKIAQTYLVDAYYCYIRWGAQAKAEDLSKRYPELLASVVKQEQIDWQSSEQSYRSSYTSTFALSSNQTFIGSQSSISNSLDLTAIIKASQALSGEIEMEQLLSTLMKVVMENAGASKCALILSAGENAGLTVSAVSCDSNTCIFPNTSLELSCDVPITLINYVKRTKEISVIDDARLEQFLASDRYIVERQPQSLLSIPILNQGKFLGILYLENNLTTKAFTPERTELLKVITTQAAISLKNAILYKNLEEYSHTLEEKVEQRTQQLHQNNLRLQEAIQKLQSAQTQLIQSEKMSSLGQMVAGIAHEINNPISFIHGNLAHARDYVQNLLDLIAIYQHEYPHPTAKVVQKTEEIDLNFLQEDLPKLLDSMEIGTSRICNIVLGLRNFSRLDEAEMKAVDIHEGIDNTLMILQHRLQAKGDRPEISVIKEYGQLPKVTCYAGQLNQVFMNILSNAIDALEQKIQRSRSVPDGISPCICIRTELTENQTVKILIADNGIGMTAEVKQKIFDPFFTTKPVGSGTGLGLSISYQIIVEKHKGQLSCNSIPGSGTEFVMEIPLSK